MERVVFLDRNAIKVPMRRPAFAHAWIEHAHTPAPETIERLRDATIAITNRVAITTDVLAAVPTLRLVAVAATGYEHVDVPACARAGVAVCNVRDWSVSVPEHVFAMALALRRQLLAYRSAVREGRWAASPTYGLLLEPLPRTLSGGVLGVVGHGALGRRVEALGRGFGMEIQIAERKGAASVRAGRVPFEQVLAASDLLAVLCPLTAETKGLIGADELAAMRPDALLVNCARGGIVDEAALVAALRAGTIAGAGVDVLSEEPPRHGNPLLDADLPNLIVTPHMAWASIESMKTLVDQLIGNVEAFVAGAPRNLVT
jgi:glycerate dehydrogenase